MTAKLSTLDRFLPVWIGLAMATGLLLGRLIPDLNTSLERIKVDTVSLPIAIGLLAMMYPVLAKVRYRHLGDELADRRTIGLSLVLNWVVGPLLMFTLAWVFLADLPELRTGLIIVGLARCIAMVLIWNDLACGSRELAAVLVAINSLFQIVMYSRARLVLPDRAARLARLRHRGPPRVDVGHRQVGAHLPRHPAARRVPDPHHRRSPQGHRLVRAHASCPASAPSPSTGCCSPSSCSSPCRATRSPPTRSTSPASPCRCSSTSPSCGPARSSTGYRLRFPYNRNASVAFTAAGNNFELAIAVSIAVFGVTSGQALAGTIGPLIEVPALVALVYVSLWAKRRFYAVAGKMHP